MQLEAMPRAQPFIDGGEILFRGEPYRLYSPSPRGHPHFDEGSLHMNVPAHCDTLAGRTKRFLIREAREALTNCTHVHARALGKTV